MAHKLLHPIMPKAQCRFWQKVRKSGTDQCWLWFGVFTEKGYGCCYPYGAEGGRFRSHRVAYFLTYGIDLGPFNGIHKCDNPACCNPSHIAPARQADNLADMRSKGRGYNFPVLYGEEAPHVKLTDAEVADIRWLAGRGRRRMPGYWSERRLAEKYGVVRSQIHRIVRGGNR